VVEREHRGTLYIYIYIYIHMDIWHDIRYINTIAGLEVSLPLSLLAKLHFNYLHFGCWMASGIPSHHTQASMLALVES